MRVLSIIVLLCILLTTLVSAEKTTIPTEDLKMYQVIELWDTVPADQLSPSGDLVRSFRDVDSEYLRQKAFTATSSYQDLDVFKQNRHIEDVLAMVNANTFTAVDTTAYVWSMQFTNKKYPKYVSTRTQLDISSPDVETDQQVYLLVHLPVKEEDIILASGSAQIFNDVEGATVLYKGDNIASTLYLKRDLTKEEIDALTITSFYKTVVVEEITIAEQEPQTQSPMLIVTPEEQKKNSLAVILFSIIPVPLLVVFGVWYHKKKRMEDLILKYSTPHAHVEPTPEEKHAHTWSDSFHHLLERFHKK